MLAENIKNKQDFINFVQELLDDLKNNPDTWGNNNLDGFLAALISWVEDMDGYYINRGEKAVADVNWRVFADILMGAKVYD